MFIGQKDNPKLGCLFLFCRNRTIRARNILLIIPLRKGERNNGIVATTTIDPCPEYSFQSKLFIS